MQKKDQRDFGSSRMMSKDVKATYFDTLKMAGKVSIDPKNAILKRRCDPAIPRACSSNCLLRSCSEMVYPGRV